MIRVNIVCFIMGIGIYMKNSQPKIRVNIVCFIIFNSLPLVKTKSWIRVNIVCFIMAKLDSLNKQLEG